jgi:hypothetical protein
VFVFDQIDKLLSKYDRRVCSISGLLFPYNMIKRVMREGRVTSVISASANSEVAVIGHHDRFEAYNLPVSMSRSELTKAFYKLRKRTKSSEKLLSSTMSLTKGVTRYAAKFLGTFNNSESDFRRFVIQLMKKDWEVLLDKSMIKRPALAWSLLIYCRSSGENKVLPL